MKLYSIPLGLLATGLLLIAMFNSSGRYRDPSWASRIPDYDDAAFVQARAANTTLGSKLWHLGASLATIGIALGIGFAALRLKDLTDLKKLQTPRTRWPLFLLTVVTFLAFFPAIGAWIRYTRSRGDYPVWDDAFVKFGPLMLAALVLLAAPVVIVALTICTSRSRLPASFWLRPRNLLGWLATGLALPSAGLLMFGIATSVFSDPFFMPLELSLLYLVGCARAAAASSAQ